jgi:hypothetical protein
MTFQTHQAEFAAYIRNPSKNSLPKGVKPQRMKMYRELFFNNIQGFLSANFPVLRTLFDEENWQNLVQDFFESHVCKTPHFSEIPEEFLAYLQNERKNSTDFPFLIELAHYEWVEMALSISHEAFKKSEFKNLISSKLKLSSLAVALAYQFPVHKISVQFLPKESEQPTFLAVYRNENDAVQFLEITPLTFQLLQFIENYPEQSADFYFEKLTEVAPPFFAEGLRENGVEILKDFAARGVVLAG